MAVALLEEDEEDDFDGGDAEVTLEIVDDAVEMVEDSTGIVVTTSAVP